MAWGAIPGISRISVPCPLWCKAVWWLAPPAYTFLKELLDEGAQTEDVEDLEWRRVAVKYDNLNSTATADDAWVGFDIVNVTDGDPDPTWTDADFVSAEGHLDTFFNDSKASCSTNYQVSEYRWYRRRFNPYGVPEAFADSGPPVRVTPRTYTGVSAYGGATQIAASLTERTTFPKHWGRTYMPGVWQIGANGRFGSSLVNQIADQAKTLYEGLGGDDFTIVVPMTQLDGDPNRGLLHVTKVAVDDIPDVIRRRRLSNVVTRAVRPV